MVQSIQPSFNSARKPRMTETTKTALLAMAPYKDNDKDTRDWGSYEVLSITNAAREGGEDVCTKTITVNPKRALSLQIHAGRAENWAVQSGTLHAIVNGELHTIKAGENIDLPAQSLHCMINVGDEPVTLIEVQRGICREADNYRVADTAQPPRQMDTVEIECGRAYIGPFGVEKSAEVVEKSVRLYEEIAKSFGVKPAVANFPRPA